MNSAAISMQGIVRNRNERVIADYWDRKQHSVINLPPSESDLYHHHLGIGEFDRTVLNAPPDTRDARIMAEIHRMETAQVNLIIQGLGKVSPASRVMDAGSGRGGTSFMIHQQFGCQVDGLSLSRYQVEFATTQAKVRGCADKVRFHHQNMCATSFPDRSFDYIVANETDMYVDPVEAYTEFARLLTPGGRFVFVTWCCNDAVDPYCLQAQAIDENYPGTYTHSRGTLFKALAQAGLAPSYVANLTAAPILYLELRSHAAGRTGVEKHYLDGFLTNRINYLAVAAERVIPASRA